jgi:hypothetical protein
VHQQLQALADAIDVSLGQDMHLDACDGEGGHAKLRLGFRSRSIPDKIYGVVATPALAAACRSWVKILLKKEYFWISDAWDGLFEGARPVRGPNRPIWG